MKISETAEAKRLAEDQAKQAYWKRWGSYLSKRQWGTVREDYSADGNAWDYFPHDHARSRAYRWGEDGIGGFCDNHQLLCFALSLWNGNDPILKERMFGLTNGEGNHGEDVKEYYFYLDNTPSHSYMSFLYKYPQAAYPYENLLQENRRRKDNEPASFEYELLDTGVFAENRYFDVLVTYAKNDAEDIFIQVDVSNRGPEPAALQLLPTLWCRNTWAWGASNIVKPSLQLVRNDPGLSVVHAQIDEIPSDFWWYCENSEVLFTENETNRERFGWGANPTPYVKDSIHDYIISAGQRGGHNPEKKGTKAVARYQLTIAAGATQTIRMRLCNKPDIAQPFDATFSSTIQQRQREADEFYNAVAPAALSADMKRVQRQAFAGLLWGKQFYNYVVQDWLDGDKSGPTPPPQRKCRAGRAGCGGDARNVDWGHLYNEDVLSMPDDWEYPWFAAWDLAFHTIPLAIIDPDFAKRQLYLLTREWYMHPNGQMPAYEWAFGDVNPPVHAWAALEIYQIEQKLYGNTDRDFLEEIFQKLMLNFTWWVNIKDMEGNNVFQGGFLGMDNISVFDRSAKVLPTGGYINQSDGTSWMGMYCLNLLQIAIELTRRDQTYLSMATKLFQHFLYLADAMNIVGDVDINMWDDQDGFYYDVLQLPPDRLLDGKTYCSLKVRSMTGLIPLLAVETIAASDWQYGSFTEFADRFKWFLQNRPQLTRHDNINILGGGPDADDILLSLVKPDRLRRILSKMLDESEFLSPHGVRSVSRYHLQHPYILWVDSVPYRVDYTPAESQSGLFGGNSNWRGPIWFPINYLLVQALQKFHSFFGDTFTVEYPSGSGQQMTLLQISQELAKRLVGIFLNDAQGLRPVYGGLEQFQHDAHWHDLIMFYEYFHGDNGAGLGASHQTGWTALVAMLLQQAGGDLRMLVRPQASEDTTLADTATLVA